MMKAHVLKSFIISIIVYFLSLIACNNVLADMINKASEDHSPQPVIIGIYVTDIFGGDISTKTVDIAFWLWVIYKDKTLTPLDHIDIVNAESVKRLSYEITRLDDGYYWAGGKYHAKLHQNWDFTSYPLDSQGIEFVFEDTRYGSDQLVYVIDNADSDVDLQVSLDGWRVLNSYWKLKNYHYKSNFGVINSNSTGDTTYSRAIYKIELKREGIRKLIQVFGVAYLACFLAFCIYFLPLNELRGRLGLITGAIFALVGNKLLTDSYLPQATGLTLVDLVQLTAMVFLSITILMTVIIYYFHKHEKIKFARWVNSICILLALILVPGVQVLLLLSH
ncbi:hypothetical protein L3V82_08650 [Thiotrichales bacterium 19S3-7]|nr:hypothetical protein [Thiotrichales bacterium 19S3-7]MCF6802212.1 hypothetical protein [Thiotrichales bacterium 19S3-11]